MISNEFDIQRIKNFRQLNTVEQVIQEKKDVFHQSTDSINSNQLIEEDIFVKKAPDLFVKDTDSQV